MESLQLTSTWEITLKNKCSEDINKPEHSGMLGYKKSIPVV